MGKWRFESEVDPSDDMISRVAACAPENPFYTPSYARARRVLGQRVCTLGVHSDTGYIGCLGFLQGWRLISLTLEITSLPTLPADAGTVFWEGLLVFARARGVWDLDLQSYGSKAVVIPDIASGMVRRSRLEYIVDLATFTPQHLASNHRRNAVKARKFRLAIQSSDDPAKADEHVALMRASMSRRARRGETVPTDHNSKWEHAMLGSRAAKLMQAYDGDTLRSSMCLLRSKQGAYYESAGTSSDGMIQGASHMLVSEIISALAREGLHTFNLGGVGPENPGLERFKQGFHARPVPLEAATVCIRPALHQKARTTIQTAYGTLRELPNCVSRVERYFAYSIDPQRVLAPTPCPGIELRKLTDDELYTLAHTYDELEHTRSVIANTSYNDAFGVFVDGALAHIAWLITADHDALNERRNVKLRAGEAEITHCHTLQAFRGRGVYPFAIRTLSKQAAQVGVFRVFMITNVSNTASQRGIVKAGLEPIGRIVRWMMPPLGDRAALTLRTHRRHRVNAHHNERSPLLPR
jgi:hypothetical protein